MAYDLVQIEQMSPHIGAVIHGVDMREALAEPVKKELHQALLEYKVIFFRDQDVTTAQHIEFARNFGDLEIHPFVPHKEGYPEAMLLVHDKDFRGQENAWHSDVTWRKEPSLGSILRAIEVPEVGGDTLFADMYAAYEGLSDKVQHMLDGLVAVHDFTLAFGRGLPPEKLKKLQEEYPKSEHPVIRTHPETGRKGIYVNVAFTTHIKGMRFDESHELLRFLYAQAGIPEYQCRFKWYANSVAFWDNRSTQHYAVSDYHPHRRHMERVTIVGDKPF